MPLSVSKTAIPLDSALPIAESIAEALAPFCQNLQVAGSVRRRVAQVHDVEIVAVPRLAKLQAALFDDVLPSDPPVSLLHEHLEDREHAGTVRRRRDRNGRTFWGPSDKRMLWRYGAASTDWIAVDLFGATPETLGAKLALRTGPAELSKRLVTPKAKGGLLPNDLEFRSGGLYRYVGAPARRVFVPTPDEETLFRELGLPYTAPEHRFATSYAPPPGRRHLP
jgi:DNA polymerase/3'-5' exonuclease PolX